MTTIANWFGKKMGLASSIAISGVGFGGLLVPVLVRFIDLYDWRTVMTIIAVGILAIVLPLSLLFRHKPEQYGYLPDGQTELPATTSNVPKQAQPADIVITAKRAIKSNIFWRTLLPFTFMTIIIGAVMTHIMPYLSSVGITRSMSSFVVTAIALTTSSGQLGLGWLGDRFDKRRLLSGYFLLMGLGLICLAYSSETNVWLLIPFVVFHAIGFGNLPIMGASMVRGYFGRAHFGSIFGLQFGVGALVGMLGPYLAGWAYDNWGSYQNIWLIFSTLSIPPLALLLTLPPIRLATKLADKPGV
jgi:MFS family permease